MNLNIFVITDNNHNPNLNLRLVCFCMQIKQTVWQTKQVKFILALLLVYSNQHLHTYWWLVRWPGDEDPLISLCILGVQTVEDVARLLRCEQRKQEVIVVFVPALCRLSA